MDPEHVTSSVIDLFMQATEHPKWLLVAVIAGSLIVLVSRHNLLGVFLGDIIAVLGTAGFVARAITADTVAPSIYWALLAVLILAAASLAARAIPRTTTPGTRR